MEANTISLLPIILSDVEALGSIKEKSRSRYKKTWEKFLTILDKLDEIQHRVPSEMELMDFMKHMRIEEGNDFVPYIFKYVLKFWMIYYLEKI